MCRFGDCHSRRREGKERVWTNKENFSGERYTKKKKIITLVVYGKKDEVCASRLRTDTVRAHRPRRERESEKV